MALQKSSLNFTAFQRLESLLESSLEDASGRLSAYAQRFLCIHVHATSELDVERLVESPGFGWRYGDLVRVGFEGPCRGDLVLSLTHQAANQLANVLLGDDLAPSEEDDVEGRVLAEMECAQILAYTFLRELSLATGATFFPRPSEFLQDMAASLIQRTVRELDSLWQAELQMQTDQRTLNCHVALALSPELLQLLGT